MYLAVDVVSLRLFLANGVAEHGCDGELLLDRKCESQNQRTSQVLETRYCLNASGRNFAPPVVSSAPLFQAFSRPVTFRKNDIQ